MAHHIVSFCCLDVVSDKIKHVGNGSDNATIGVKRKSAGRRARYEVVLDCSQDLVGVYIR